MGDRAVAPAPAPASRVDEFDDRFEKARPRLLAICRFLAGVADAEDVVQETYLRARERIGQLRDPHLFEAWLARIALNEARSVLRHETSLRSRMTSVVPTSPTPSDPDLRNLVDQLPIRERMAVVLYYGYGYRLGEVATLLGISPMNTRTVVFRARRKLRRQLEDTHLDTAI